MKKSNKKLLFYLILMSVLFSGCYDNSENERKKAEEIAQEKAKELRIKELREEQLAITNQLLDQYNPVVLDSIHIPDNTTSFKIQKLLKTSGKIFFVGCLRDIVEKDEGIILKLKYGDFGLLHQYKENPRPIIYFDLTLTKDQLKLFENIVFVDEENSMLELNQKFGICYNSKFFIVCEVYSSLSKGNRVFLAEGNLIDAIKVPTIK